METRQNGDRSSSLGDGAVSTLRNMDRLWTLAGGWSRWQRVVNLLVMALSELLGGFTFSLLSPFYTKEATDKGMTVAETGLVRSQSLVHILN